MVLFGQNSGPIIAGPNDAFNVFGSGPTYAGVHIFYTSNFAIADHLFGTT